MKLSVIIPVYNVENYIEDCVSSLFNQNIKVEDFEIILVNDGSTDNSLKVCETLRDKYSNVRLFNQNNQGQSVARNFGLNQAEGEYVYFIDSDDYLKDSYIGLLLDELYKQSLDFIGFQYEITSSRVQNHKSTQALEEICQGNGIEILRSFHYNNGPCWYIVKKSTIGTLRFEEDRLCEDGLFTAQLLLKIEKGIVYSNEIYCYYDNPTSTVNTVNIARLEKINTDMYYAANRFKEIISLLPFRNTDDPAFIRLKDRQESYTFFAMVRSLKSKKSYKEILQALTELKKGVYPAYPITTFKGYNDKRNKILIFLFNNLNLLKLAVRLNKTFNLVKDA